MPYEPTQVTHHDLPWTADHGEGGGGGLGEGGRRGLPRRDPSACDGVAGGSPLPGLYAAVTSIH